jgi:hypothetical protein
MTSIASPPKRAHCAERCVDDACVRARREDTDAAAADPDLLNSRFAYVSISRASHQATLFTDDMAKLGPQLRADVSKTSALEINQTSLGGLGIGLAR